MLYNNNLNGNIKDKNISKQEAKVYIPVLVLLYHKLLIKRITKY